MVMGDDDAKTSRGKDVFSREQKRRTGGGGGAESVAFGVGKSHESAALENRSRGGNGKRLYVWKKKETRRR